MCIGLSWKALFIEKGIGCKACNMIIINIRQHGGGCLYPVIQRKSSTSVLQDFKVAKRTGKEKVQTTYQGVLTVLLREHAPAHGKCSRHFPPFVILFFLFSHCSSSQTMRNMEKISPQYIARHSMDCIPLCI